MKFNFIIFACLSMLSFSQNVYECDKLPNGKYHVAFDKYFKIYEDYDFVINNDSYTKYLNNGDSIKGKFIWIYGCTFQFVTPIKPNLDSMTEFEKLHYKSFGDNCIELKEQHGDTINFRTTFTGNIHIATNIGQIIKLQ